MYEYAAELDRVIDGDTVVLWVDLGFHTWKQVHVRVAGIDTPEIRTSDAAEKVAGFAAKDEMERLLAQDSIYRVRVLGPDKYGDRWVADIFVGDLNVGQELLRTGHAKVYP